MYKFESNGKTYYITRVPEIDDDRAVIEVEGKQIEVRLNPNSA